MKSALVLLVTLLLVTSSCHRQQQQYPARLDRLVFGTFYGMCAFNCVKLYQLDRQALRKDDSANYQSISWDYSFSTTRVMDQNKFNAAKDLFFHVPDELISRDDVTYGCPDCHDQGGIFVQLYRGGAIQSFRIDFDNTADQSEEIKNFKQRIVSVMQQME